MEWGQHEKFLLEKKEQTGVTPPALLRKPEARFSFVEDQYYEAYDTISHSRTYYGKGFPNPLQISEILAYIKLIGLDDSDYAVRMFAVVKKMDDAYLDFWISKNN